MTNSLRVLFVFIILIFILGLFLFKNYRSLELGQRIFIKQERNSIKRMNYLEQIGRNDFKNYTFLLENGCDPSITLNEGSFSESDSLTKITTGLIADFWLLISSGKETAELDSLKQYRNKYLAALNKYYEANSTSKAQQKKELITAFAAYHNIHTNLTNKQYSTISSYLRRSQETMLNELKTMIALFLCCILITILLSYFVYVQFRKLK